MPELGLVTQVSFFLGSVFMFLAGLGLLRMPDLYLRLQPATKASTLGVSLLLLGSLLELQSTPSTAKGLLVLAFIVITAPVAAHAIARAAHRRKQAVWSGMRTDELRESK